MVYAKRCLFACGTNAKAFIWVSLSIVAAVWLEHCIERTVNYVWPPPSAESLGFNWLGWFIFVILLLIAAAIAYPAARVEGEATDATGADASPESDLELAQPKKGRIERRAQSAGRAGNHHRGRTGNAFSSENQWFPKTGPATTYFNAARAWEIM